MAKNEEFGKLSPEQVQKLSNSISEAKNLTIKQAEIIDSVLKGEEDIGKIRISYLKEYFDTYSKNLDLVAKKYAKTIKEAEYFGRERADKVNKRAEEEALNKIKSELEEKRRKLEFEARDKHRGKLLKKDAIEIEKQIAKEFETRSKNQRRLAKEREELFKRERLAYEDPRLAGAIKAYEHQASKQTKELTAARDQAPEHQEYRLVETRLKSLTQALSPELEAQNLINKINSEIAFANTSEAGEYKSREVDAKTDIAALKELENEINAYRNELNYESRSKNNNILFAEEATANERLVHEKFAQSKELLLEQIKLEALEREKIDRLQKNDPNIAAERAAAVAKRVKELELKYREENNNILEANTLKAIKKQAEAEFAADSDNVGKLAEEYTEKMRQAKLKENDLALFEAFDKKRTERKRVLELEALRRNHGIITEEDHKAINDTLNEEFQVRSEKSIKLLEDLGKKQLVDAEITTLKTKDPELAADVEAKIKQEIADLEYQYRLEHNNELNAQAIEDIEYQAKLRYTHESELQKLAAQRLQEETESRYKEANNEAGAAIEAHRAKLVAEEERKLRQQNNRLLTKEEHDAIVEKYKKEYTISEKNMKQLAAIQEREDKKKKRADIAKTDQEVAQAVQLGGFSKEDNLLKRMDSLAAMVDSVDDEDRGKAELAVAIKAISNLAAQLESSIDKIGSYKGNIDTRLQGSNNKTVFGSYWDQLNRDMMSVGAVTPFFKQEDFANNIKTLVDRGISFDLKQRAFLMTIQEKIANTFDVADGTLLRLIRIQQEDSTAGRLGMESALNSFLNNMYETSEYLSDVAASVRGSLQEMEALMTGAEATEVEYQVQKWMGSLYSVGMSQEAVNSIATALGQIAAGQIEALTSGNGAGNLMVMAANEAGIPISNILTTGLDAKETNRLLQATVNYLAELAEASKDSNVVQQQLANVFGVKASDLKAATNLATNDTTSNVFGSYLTYDNMLKQLNTMAGTMYKRTSIGEMMSNIWENGQYTLAGSMANNPVSYLIYKIASLLDSTVGGIAIPAVSVLGNMVDLETTVADLMRVASVSTGILGSLGPMISGLANSFSGQAMLKKMGIDSGSGLTITPRGTASSIGASDLSGGGAQTTSGSGYVGNGSPSDIKDSTMQEAEDSKKQQMIEAKEEAEATQIDFINTNVLKIYELLDEVANGKRSFSVKVAGYGLTNLGSNTSMSGAQGGVAGLLSNSPANSAANSGSLSGGFSSGSNSNSTNTNSNSDSDFGSSSGINLGGWSVMA